MAKKICVVAFVIAVLSVSVTFGQQEQSVEPCSEATTTIEMLECLTQEYEKADAELNRVYRELVSRLSKSRQTKLRDAQRAWIVFRDKSAEFEASAEEGGSMANLVRLLEMSERTKRRVYELREILKRTK